MARKEGQTNIQISVSRDEAVRVKEFARQKRGYKIISDYVRALIEADMAAHGEDFTFEVDRGGYRRGEDSEE